MFPSQSHLSLFLPILVLGWFTPNALAQPQKDKLPRIPQVIDAKWPSNAIDHFVLARIEARNLKPSPEASRHVLARRAALTLTGVPPSLKELKRFLEDKNNNAYEAMIDRLLKSPAHKKYWAIMTDHYGRPKNFKNALLAGAWARDLWQHVFGLELKSRVHPHLHNYLLTVVQQGEDDAKLLRLLMTTTAFRQSSDVSPAVEKEDPDNELLARYQKTRLPMWTINRCILSLSGLTADAEKVLDDDYLFPEPRMPPQPNPPGTLFILPEKWIWKASTILGNQIRTSGQTDEDRLRYAMLLVVQRLPKENEMAKITQRIDEVRKDRAKDADLRKKLARAGIEIPQGVDIVEGTVWVEVGWAWINTHDFCYKP
jgi:hypothetical protein